jgi:hypothetical protein
VSESSVKRRLPHAHYPHWSFGLKWLVHVHDTHGKQASRNMSVVALLGHGGEQAEFGLEPVANQSILSSLDRDVLGHGPRYLGLEMLSEV